MPSKSKAKGSSYERDLAKFLSEKYNGSFVRVPNSGAYIGGSNFHRATNLSEGQVRGFKGDIIPLITGSILIANARIMLISLFTIFYTIKKFRF